MFTLIISGCSNGDNSSSSGEIESQQNINSKEIDLPESPTDESTSNTFVGFTDEEIESAKKVAETYYRDRLFKIIEMKFDLTNSIYKNYSSEYEESNLITFTVKIANSDNPPRQIALIRKDSDSSWEVLSEGY